MIPLEQREVVARGLQEAFGVTEFEDISQMTRGLSSDLVFRVVVHDTPYLLRVVTRVNQQTDPKRHFASMRSAAEGGVGPRVWYTNAEDGVAITDFVDTVPFARAVALVEIPRTLRKLHALPAFAQTFNYVTAHKGFIWRFRGAGLLSANEIGEVYPRYEQICAAYPRLDSDVVPSHSDLKPENILYDGRRVWLVDWQAAFMNDRYFDLAVAGNFVLGDERAWLEEYFGRPADEYQMARFFLMRQVVHMFYASVFLLLGAAGGAVDLGESLPSFAEVHERIWAGGVNLGDDATKIVYGRVHWARLLENVRMARFEEALRIVGERHAGEARLLPIVP